MVTVMCVTLSRKYHFSLRVESKGKGARHAMALRMAMEIAAGETGCLFSMKST